MAPCGGVSANHPVRQDLRSRWLGGARRGQGGYGGLAVPVLHCSVCEGEWMVTGEPGHSNKTTTETRDGAISEASEHVEVCPRCGQPFDNRILHQVIYHDQPEHKPIETNI